MKGGGEMFEVKALVAQGKSLRVIARELGMDRKTVRKLAQATAVPARTAAPRRPSKLGPFVSYLEAWLAAGVSTGAVLLREIAERGYPGKQSILRDWLGQRVVAEHALRSDRGGVIVLPEHLAFRPAPASSPGWLRLLPSASSGQAPGPQVPTRSLVVYQAVVEAEA